MPYPRGTISWLQRTLSLLSLISLAQAVVPSGDPCGRSLPYRGNLTVSTAADVDAINRANCVKITCNLIVEKTFPGLATFPTISLVENTIRVGNDLREPVQASALTGLSFPNLTRANDIAIAAASGITTLDFPVLGYVDLLSLINLPNLQNWTGFRSLTRVSYVRLVNVGLSSVAWDDNEAPVVITSLYMANNTNLNEISLLDLGDVSGGTVEIHGNGATKISLTLESVRYLEITGCASFADQGLYYLHQITGAREDDGYLRLYNNTFSVLKLSSLTKVNGSIEIHSNPSLTSVSMPALQTVNGFLEITDNDRLKTINTNDLQNLRYVSQGVNLTGTFEKINLPVDTRVRYAMVIASTANISCRPFDGAFLSGYYGRYACAPNGQKPVLAYNGSRNGSDSSGDNIGVLPRAAFLTICIVIPILSLIFWSCVICWLIIRRRRKRRQAELLKAQTRDQIRNSVTPHERPVSFAGEKLLTWPNRTSMAPPPPLGSQPPFPAHQAASPTPTPDMATSAGPDSGARAAELGTGMDHANERDAQEHSLEERERERQRREQELVERESALGERERQIEAREREQSLKRTSELQ